MEESSLADRDQNEWEEKRREDRSRIKVSGVRSRGGSRIEATSK
jgi:hypothetical protein